MASGYIPAKQEDLASWANNFSALVTAAPTTYGLVAGDATTIAAAVAPFLTALPIATDPGTRTSVTVATKDAARANLLAIVRPYAVSISLNPGVAADDKVAVGVNPRTTIPSPVPPPATNPLLSFILARHLVHQLSAADVLTPDKRAKPFGALALQVWQFVGTTVPTGPEDASFFANVTKTPFQVTYASDALGKRAYYWGRWQTRTGEVGPWSPVVSAVVL